MNNFAKGKSALLNRPTHNTVAAASISFSISSWKNSKDVEIKNLNGELVISDCSRVIYLDLNAGSYSELENAIFKLKTLKEICEFGLEYVEECIKEERLNFHKDE